MGETITFLKESFSASKACKTLFKTGVLFKGGEFQENKDSFVFWESDKKPSSVQSLIFSKSKYSPDTAKAWAKSHGYAFGDVDVTGDSIRLRQQEPGDMKRFRTIDLTDGVKAVIGISKEDEDQESIASGANSPLLKAKVHEAAKVAGPISAGVYKVILISEGLGNRNNMNFYGPEAINSAPAIFEGKPAYKNHPSESEEQDIPERRVEDQIGFYKNCKVETVDGLRACTGELHLEGTELGNWAKQKLDFALLYKKQFPKSEDEYCGFSVAAAGESERRVMDVDGSEESVNYLTAFTGARSCDMVTTPARGGKVLQVLESQRGLNSKEKGTFMKELIKQINDEIGKLDAALSADTKADDSVKAAAANLKKLCSGLSQGESEEDGESEEGDEADKKDPAAKDGEPVKKEGEGSDVMSDDPEKKPGADKAPDAEVPPVAKKEESESEEDEAEESNKLAIKFLLNEAGDDVKKIIGTGVPKTLKEAKSRIADITATLKIVRESVVPAGNPAKGGQEVNTGYQPKL